MLYLSRLSQWTLQYLFSQNIISQIICKISFKTDCAFLINKYYSGNEWCLAIYKLFLEKVGILVHLVAGVRGHNRRAEHRNKNSLKLSKANQPKSIGNIPPKRHWIFSRYDIHMYVYIAFICYRAHSHLVPGDICPPENLFTVNI